MGFVIYIKCRKCGNWCTFQGPSTLQRLLNAFLVLVQQTKSETESKNQGNINSQLILTQKQHISTLN
jgi:hypothetical protein